jgi:hypothetical protein
MKPEVIEEFRLSLLRYLDEDGSATFGLPTLRLFARGMGEGFRNLQEDTERELEYLVEKGLAREVDKVLSPANRSWKITAAGRDHREKMAR